jgi:hypothetical protein
MTQPFFSQMLRNQLRRLFKWAVIEAFTAWAVWTGFSGWAVALQGSRASTSSRRTALDNGIRSIGVSS